MFLIIPNNSLLFQKLYVLLQYEQNGRYNQQLTQRSQ